MKKFLLFFLLSVCITTLIVAQKPLANVKQITIGKLLNGGIVSLRKSGDSKWGIYVEKAGLSTAFQTAPAQIEIYPDSVNISKASSGYEQVNKTGNGFTGKAVIKTGKAMFIVNDQWKITGNVLQLNRNVKVAGSNIGAGFLSAITFINQQKQTRSNVNYFAPGMIYGSTENLTEVAIGGKKSGLVTWIREDRLPAPLFGIQYKDGTSVSILNPQPDGNTTKEDSRDLQVKDLIDGRFRFGSLGVQQIKDNIEYGYMWPGSEGAYTYKGRTYPGGQLNKWRRRYHPVQSGFMQQYKVDFRFANKEDQFPAYYKNAWRWAYNILNPKVNFQDIETARRSLVDMLGDRVQAKNGLSGIAKAMPAVTSAAAPNRTTTMGFVGKALECSNFLLQDADRGQSPLDSLHRQQAINIINSFVKTITLSPPNGEGFNMDTGIPLMNRPQDGKMYLRSFGDDLKSLLRAVKREKKQGRLHEDWLAWAKSLAIGYFHNKALQAVFREGGKLVQEK